MAATAFILRCKLATKNMKDFKNIREIAAEEPY
jgi:predicted nucleic acid-binding protein